MGGIPRSAPKPVLQFGRFQHLGPRSALPDATTPPKRALLINPFTLLFQPLRGARAMLFFLFRKNAFFSCFHRPASVTSRPIICNRLANNVFAVLAVNNPVHFFMDKTTITAFYAATNSYVYPFAIVSLQNSVLHLIKALFQGLFTFFS